jgi:signal recognition particle subunit SRP54
LFGGDIPQEALDQAMDDKELVKIESMIHSMTKKERSNPDLFLLDGGLKDSAAAKLGRKKKTPKRRDPTKLAEMGPEAFVDTRVNRVARGSGRDDEDVRALVGRFLAMRDMFGMLGDLMGGSGMLGKLPGIKQVKQMNAMRKLAQNPEALQAMFGGGGMPGGMPAGMPGLGAMPGMPAMQGSGGGSKKSKDQRKKEKAARKKNRRR